MKNLIFSISLITALGLSSCGNAQSSKEQNESNTQTAQVINKDVDVETFEKIMSEGDGLLLDVRTDREFASGHLKGATQIDYRSANFEKEVVELDKSVPVYIYCRSGGRSGEAAHLMKGMGFSEVYNLEGGILAWERAGKPVIK